MLLFVFYIYILFEYIINEDFCDRKIGKNDKLRNNIISIWWFMIVCFFFLIGVFVLDVGVDGIIGLIIVVGFMLVVIVIVFVILCYK